jgi:predicted MFS family arabinose efflux permease
MLGVDNKKPTPKEDEAPKRFFVPALAIALFSAGISNSVITLFAVDIAKTFLGSSSGSSVGVVSQLNTANASATVAFAIMLSVLAIRFRQKYLFLSGVALVVASAVGSFFAPTLLSLQLFYAMEGGGSIIIWIMAATLIGDILPQDKKAKAISYMISIGSIATLVVVFLVGFIGNVGGWRSNFLFLVLPFAAAGLVIVSFFVPSAMHQKPTSIKKNIYLGNLRQVLTNKSAVACLIANIFTLVTGQAGIFAIAFYRTRFAVPRTLTVGIYELAVIIFIVSPLISGRIVNRVGAKRLAVISTSIAASCLMIFFLVPNLWIALTFDMLHVWFGTFSIPAFVCLVLEQTPKSRGTMMSLNSLFNSIGNAIAPAIGGALLLLTSGFYGSIGIIYGGMTFFGVAILIFLVADPTKKTFGS